MRIKYKICVKEMLLMNLKNKIALGLIGTAMYLLVSVWLLMPLVKLYQLAVNLNQNVNSKADFSPIKQMYVNLISTEVESF